MDGNIWNLKTLLSSHTSFKVDIPEVEAQSIPEMNHYFVTWNIYSIPTIKSPEQSSISSQPKTGLLGHVLPIMIICKNCEPIKARKKFNTS